MRNRKFNLIVSTKVLNADFAYRNTEYMSAHGMDVIVLTINHNEKDGTTTQYNVEPRGVTAYYDPKTECYISEMRDVFVSSFCNAEQSGSSQAVKYTASFPFFRLPENDYELVVGFAHGYDELNLCHSDTTVTLSSVDEVVTLPNIFCEEAIYEDIEIPVSLGHQMPASEIDAESLPFD